MNFVSRSGGESEQKQLVVVGYEVAGPPGQNHLCGEGDHFIREEGIRF